MPLPTLIKSYTMSYNNVVTAAGTVAWTKMMVLAKIKDVLVNTFGWTVVGSSDAHVDWTPPASPVDSGGYGMDGTDRWGNPSSVSFMTGATPSGDYTGSRYPWIVIQKSTLGGGTYQMCLSSQGNTNNSVGTIVISPHAGFTGGGVNARPTAIDERALINNNTLHSGVNTQHIVHVIGSTDGKCFRISVHRGTTNQCLFIAIETPRDPPANWTYPVVACAFGAASGTACTFANLLSASHHGWSYGGPAPSAMAAIWTGETDAQSVDVLAHITNVGTEVNAFNSEWPMFKIGLSCKSRGARGKLGAIFDMCWKPTGIAEGDSNNATTQDWIAIGDLLWPYLGDATALLRT